MEINSKSAIRRRLIIGSNVVLTVVIVWAIIVLVNFIFYRLNLMPQDFTRGGKLSVSPRTVKLLEGLKETIRLTGMYRVDESAEEGVREQARLQSRQVEDLLRRYSTLSSKVQYNMIDPVKDTSAKTTLIQNLKIKYAGEADKHKKIFKSFKDLAPKILTLLENELRGLKQFVESNPKLGENRGVVGVYLRLNRDQTDAKQSQEEVSDLITGGDIPRYSEAITIIQKLYENLKSDLEAGSGFFMGDGQKIEELSPEVKTFFADSKNRYKDILDAVNGELKQCTDLPRLELEEIYDQVKQKNTRIIIIEAENASKVKVLGFDQVWQMAEKRQPGKVDFDFNGEAAVSSAILGLTAKDKTAVIFVHSGEPNPIKAGFNMMRMSQPPYSALKQKLEETNFVVESWDVGANPEPPVVKDVKSKVYVVVPSVPQRAQPGMPPQGGYNKDCVDRIEKVIDSGARIMFLVNFNPTIMGSPYPFTEILGKKFGLKVNADKLILRGVTIRDNLIPDNNIAVTRYSEHDITRPIQSLKSMFLWAVPMRAEEKIPEGVTVSPLITLTEGMDNFWGESNIIMLLQNRTAEKDKEDIYPPIVLGAAVENAKTKAKAVIFGNELFATDNMANMAEYAMMGNSIVAILSNPANLELVVNSCLWLNDSANLISVGPRKSDVARIGDISDRGQLAWKIFLWVIWPMGALLAGGIVYLFRRK